MAVPTGNFLKSQIYSLSHEVASDVNLQPKMQVRENLKGEGCILGVKEQNLTTVHDSFICCGKAFGAIRRFSCIRSVKTRISYEHDAHRRVA